MATKDEMRANAEARFKRNEDKAIAGRAAMAEYEAAAVKQTEKIERLRALRLASEAAAEVATTTRRTTKSSKRFSAS